MSIIRRRPVDLEVQKQALASGISPLIANILATRILADPNNPKQSLELQLSRISPPDKMADIGKAASRIAQAIIAGELIGIETDHDCDGQTSHAVFYHNMIRHFGVKSENLRSYIGHRLKEGYGLSKGVVSRILADSPKISLVITADNGSSDEGRIALLKAKGIDVIITDHHGIPADNYPSSAYAFLNPTRSDCNYGDPYIAGCMVAWLLMTAVRKELIKLGHLAATCPKLADSLDFVALGTVADCVSMARSLNNRIIVKYGMELMAKRLRPCWQVLAELFNPKPSSKILAFNIAPLLNSDGRLDTALNSVDFLLAKSEQEANAALELLRASNKERKEIQARLSKIAMQAAKGMSANYSICISLEDGHAGVHGIIASRIKDKFARPVAIFSSKLKIDSESEDLLSGSMRGIDSFNIQQALEQINQNHPQLMQSFGGHKGAGGLTIAKANFAKFADAFEQIAAKELKNEDLSPIIWTDAELSYQDLNLSLFELIEQLEPFGREFESPVFELQAEILELRPVGDGTHFKVTLELESKKVRAIWFSAVSNSGDSLGLQEGEQVKVAFIPKINEYMGQRNFDMQIVHMERPAHHP